LNAPASAVIGVAGQGKRTSQGMRFS